MNTYRVTHLFPIEFGEHDAFEIENHEKIEAAYYELRTAIIYAIHFREKNAEHQILLRQLLLLIDIIKTLIKWNQKNQLTVVAGPLKKMQNISQCQVIGAMN